MSAEVLERANAAVRASGGRVCCPVPECEQRHPETVAGSLELHHAEDGTQCPGSWPAYVVGAPVPVRRSSRGQGSRKSRRR